MLHRLVQFLEFSCSILGLPKYDEVDNQFTISIEVNFLRISLENCFSQVSTSAI